jgi:hypothetical protein
MNSPAALGCTRLHSAALGCTKYTTDSLKICLSNFSRKYRGLCRPIARAIYLLQNRDAQGNRSINHPYFHEPRIKSVLLLFVCRCESPFICKNQRFCRTRKNRREKTLSERRTLHNNFPVFFSSFLFTLFLIFFYITRAPSLFSPVTHEQSSST